MVMLLPKISQKGITLVETLVGIAVFLVISIGVYQSFVLITKAVSFSRIKITATELANEQFEIARNLPYRDVGVVGGLPLGKIPRDQNLTRGGISFLVNTTIRSIDDPFDGTIGGTPNDLSPSDYKMMELEISCASCGNFSPLNFTANIGPSGLETSSGNGALFVKVFDAAGQSVPNATVHIENTSLVPPVSINETTNNGGVLQIVDAPPGAETYKISVSKANYSSEQTYVNGDPANPNPIKPNATVLAGQITQISFSIDAVSAINASTVESNCSAVSGASFLLSGSKKIGTEPDVLKYSQSHTTNGAGNKLISNLEWDSYGALLQSAGYNLAGTIPLLPLILSPNSTQNLKIITIAKVPRALLMTIKDGTTQLPVSDALVALEKTGYNESLYTGRGFLTQSDWSGGAGQDNFIDGTKYYNSDGKIEISSPAGEIRLKDSAGGYESSGYLISSTFDTGSSGNFHQILWEPQNQPAQSGASSVKFQIATNNDNATWNFLGPDGTGGTFYTTSQQDISSAHNGNRYLRYKVFLQTEDQNYTPNVSDISFTFTSDCVPPGQVYFSGLSGGDYQITVTKSGYQTAVSSVNVSSDWQAKEITLLP
jgi:hypothetical protein